MKTKILLLGVFALLFSACSTTKVASPTETAVPVIEITSTPEPTLPPTLTNPPSANTNLPAMRTYTDHLAGFSLDYPATWFLDDSVLASAAQSTAYVIGITSWDVRTYPTPSGKHDNAFPPGATKIEVAVLKQNMTLQEAVTQQSENGPILAQKDVTLAGGLPGVILDVNGFVGVARTLIVILNGNVIYVTGDGDLKDFETIALSLRAE
ncbi:MAG TPA: hypothetical protein VK249_21835 [Anaerolineales bacterium]|nr:hypothetical protein [Anaerolineales bacterium]